MLLSEFKENKGLSYSKIAKMFAVSRRTAINWVQSDATISGTDGRYVVKFTRTREQHFQISDD